MTGCLPTQALAFLAVFVYATHATQAIAFESKLGLVYVGRTEPKRDNGKTNKNLAIANRSRVSCINTNNNTMTLKSGLEVTQGH